MGGPQDRVTYCISLHVACRLGSVYVCVLRCKLWNNLSSDFKVEENVTIFGRRLLNALLSDEI